MVSTTRSAELSRPHEATFGVTMSPSHLFAFSQHVCILGKTNLQEMVTACTEPTSLEVGATGSLRHQQLQYCRCRVKVVLIIMMIITLLAYAELGSARQVLSLQSGLL